MIYSWGPFVRSIQSNYFFLEFRIFVLSKRSFTFQLFIWRAFIFLLQDDKGRQFVTKSFKAPFGSDSHAPKQSIWNKVQWIERIRIEQNWNPCIGIFHRPTKFDSSQSLSFFISQVILTVKLARLWANETETPARTLVVPSRVRYQKTRPSEMKVSP